MNTPTADTRINQFCSLVQQGMEAWVRAGALLCEMVRDDPLVTTRILRDSPHLTRDILEAFQRIGRKEVLPILMVDGSPGAKRLVGLPYEEQSRIYATTVRVARKTMDGIVERSVRVSDLTAAEAARVFDTNRMRSVKEQREMLKKTSTNYHFTPRAAEPEHKIAERFAIEAETPETELDGPRALLEKRLDAAHLALMQARTELAIIQPNSKLDDHIGAALGAVGKLRFALNEGQV